MTAHDSAIPSRATTDAQCTAASGRSHTASPAATAPRANHRRAAPAPARGCIAATGGRSRNAASRTAVATRSREDVPSRRRQAFGAPGPTSQAIAQGIGRVITHGWKYLCKRSVRRFRASWIRQYIVAQATAFDAGRLADLDFLQDRQHDRRTQLRRQPTERQLDDRFQLGLHDGRLRPCDRGLLTLRHFGRG